MIDKANQCLCILPPCTCLPDFHLPEILSAAQTAAATVPGAQEILFSDANLLHTLCKLRQFRVVPRSTQMSIEDLCRALVKYNTSNGRTFRSYLQAPKPLFCLGDAWVDSQALFEFAQSSLRSDLSVLHVHYFEFDSLTLMALAYFGYTECVLQWLSHRHCDSLVQWLTDFIYASDVFPSEDQLAKIATLSANFPGDYDELIDVVVRGYGDAGTPPALFVEFFGALAHRAYWRSMVIFPSLLPFAGPLAQAHAHTHTFYSYEFVREPLQWVVLSRGVEIAIGLQSLRLPVLLLNMILDEHLPLDPPTMHRKWLYLKAVRHWHQRQER